MGGKHIVIIDFQINQGAGSWSQIREAVRAVEEAGFSTVWNLDHFSGEMFQSESMFECFTTLTAWACETSRINIGTLVTNINNRHPGLLANIVSTLQDVSDGRLILGVGAGAAPSSPWGAEQRALGIEMLPTMAQRHQRLLTNIETMRHLWSQDRHESFRGFPRPHRTPRVIAGTNSIELATLAGTHLDGVNTRFNHPQRGAIVRAACTAAAHHTDFDVSVWAPFVPEYADPEHSFYKELLAEGVTRLILFESGSPEPARIAAMSRYLR